MADISANKMEDDAYDDVSIEINPLKGSGLKLAGPGLKLAGQGGPLKALLKKAADLAAKTGHPTGIVAGSALASAAHARLKKRGSGYCSGSGIDGKHIQTYVRRALHKNRHLIGDIRKVTKEHAKDWIEKHKHKNVHISDVFGEDWVSWGKDMRTILDKHLSKKEGGSKVGKAIKSVGKKALKKLKQFAAGKTRVKPSDLAKIAAAAVTVAGAASAVIPGVDLVSVPTAATIATGLKATGDALKQTGRGMHGSGSLSDAHHKLLQVLSKNKGLDKAAIRAATGLKGKALSAAHALYKSMQSGKGVVPAGGGKGKKKSCCTSCSKGGTCDRNKCKCEGPCVCGRGGVVLTGQGSGRARKYGTKREVWNGNAQMTRSGITKKGLMKNKRGKIVSIKQHKAGQRAFTANGLREYTGKFSK